MSKIFVSGSRSITNLKLIDKALESITDKDIVLVGDCYGVDTLVQEYCNFNGIPFIVYYVGTKPRNAVGISTRLKKCFGLSQKAKDIQMSIDCDKAIAIWDGQSKGTHNNILRLKDFGKDCVVFQDE